MIISTILDTVYIFVYGITLFLRNFADVTLPAGITTVIAQLGGYLGAVEMFVPVGTLLSVFGIILAAEGSIFLYKGIMWIIRRIPTQS